MIPVKTILARVDNLPTLPTAIAKLVALLQDDNASVANFEEAIRPDPALTANLLRIANSAYFGLRREVTSVSHAVAMMGTKRVFEVASSAGFNQVIPKTIPGYEIDAQAFWLHSVAVAILAERLSGELGQQTPDLTFTAGLLHDIGKLVIGSFLTKRSNTILAKVRKKDMAFVGAEHAVLGTDHAEVGGLISERWDLPEAVCVAARCHHKPDEVEPEGYQSMVDLIHTADGLAHSLGYGADVGELSRTIEPNVLKRLDIRVQQLEIVACETLDQVRQVGESYVRA